jgi:integrase
MGKSDLALASRAVEGGTVTDDARPKAALPPELQPVVRSPWPQPRPKVRRPRTKIRTREYLIHAEIELILKAASKHRHGHRDKVLILVGSRHGLRVSELIDLRWDQIDFNRAELHVRRVKRGTPSVHQIPGREMRWLRQLQRQQQPRSTFVFTSERGAPFTKRGVHKIVAKAGVAAGITFPIHPHMLRHAAGFKLANDNVNAFTIQKYLGHRTPQHTARYCELSAAQFKNLWDD